LLLFLLLLFLSLPFLLILERWFGGVKKPPPATPIGFGGGNMFDEYVVYSSRCRKEEYKVF